MTPRTAHHPPRVVRICRGWVEDAQPDETFGNGKPLVWLLVIAFELAFIAVCVAVGMQLPLWGPGGSW